MPSSVLLPDPDAPTIATEALGANRKSISWRIVSEPVASRTVLLNWLTSMIGSGISEGSLGKGDGDSWRPVTRRHCIATLAALCCGFGLALPARAAAAAPKLLVVGDSLSAEYGLKRGSGWVALLTDRLANQQPAATVVNASISGDTTAGGRSRLPALLEQHHPSHVVIELGANDALRGMPLSTTRANLEAMAQACRQAGAQVLLVGMQLPPNYGGAYTKQFAAVFPDVAKSERAALVPFMLAGVADVADPAPLFQADRLHPNERAHPRILENIWAVLGPWLKS